MTPACRPRRPTPRAPRHWPSSGADLRGASSRPARTYRSRARATRSSQSGTPSPWLPQSELNRYLCDDVHRRSLPVGRGEPPLAHGLDGALIQAGPEAAERAEIAHGAVASNDDLERHVAFDRTAPRLVGVERLHFAQERGRIDAAAWQKWPAARSPSRAGPNAIATSIAEAAARAGSGAAA